MISFSKYVINCHQNITIKITKIQFEPKSHFDFYKLLVYLAL